MEVDLNRFLKKCSCGQEHHITVENIYIESGAVRYLEEILLSYDHPVFIFDTNTKKASEESMGKYFKKYKTILLSGSEIHADNRNVEYIQQVLKADTDILIAVGSGTIHDLTRYAAYQYKIPFISIPTAPSVDGFVSTVAAMTWHGMKKTMEAAAPIYVLADTDLFGKAPYRLTASGISDLMGKYVALADWKISHMVTGEYFCPQIYELEMEAVHEVEQMLDKIKEGSKEGMEKLMYALLLSGLAMQMVGNSRPASGAEHHVSHLWEMEVINPPVDALHGEKVSVGLLLCLDYYKKILQAIQNGRCKVLENKGFETELLQETFGKKGLYEAVIKENGDDLLETLEAGKLEEKLWAISEELKQLPDAEQIKEKLGAAGCVTSMKQLNLSEDMKELTLKLCPYVRRRLTLLRLSKRFELS